MPAPTSATPTKYAASSSAAPATPPTIAASTIGVVSVAPNTELAASAPMMKPNTPSTTLNRR